MFVNNNMEKDRYALCDGLLRPYQSYEGYIAKMYASVENDRCSAADCRDRVRRSANAARGVAN